MLQFTEPLTDEEVVELEKLIVKLHEEDRTDLYSLRSVHSPENYAKAHGKQKIPPAIRFRVWRRDGFTCVFCYEYEGNLTLDHVIPEEKGGDFSEKNLVTCCAKCNNKKGNRDVFEFLLEPWLMNKRKQNLVRTSTTQQLQAASHLTSLLADKLLHTGTSS